MKVVRLLVKLTNAPGAEVLDTCKGKSLEKIDGHLGAMYPTPYTLHPTLLNPKP